MWHNRINAITIIIPDIAVSEKKRYYFQSVSKLCNWVTCTIWLRKFEVGCNLKFFGADFLVTNKLYNHRTVKRPRGDCKTCDPITIYTNAWKIFWLISIRRIQHAKGSKYIFIAQKLWLYNKERFIKSNHMSGDACIFVYGCMALISGNSPRNDFKN